MVSLARNRGFVVLVAVVACSLLASIVMSSTHGGGGGSGGPLGKAVDTPAARRQLESPGRAPGWHPKRFSLGAGGGAAAAAAAASSSSATTTTISSSGKPVRVIRLPPTDASTAAAAANDPKAAVERSQRRALTTAELAKLKELDPLPFEMVPPAGGRSWDPNLKNPCWSDPTDTGDGDGGGAKRCLPYYFVIGAWQGLAPFV